LSAIPIAAPSVREGRRPPTVLHVVDGLPSYLRVAPVAAAIAESGDVVSAIVHTGPVGRARELADLVLMGFPTADRYLGVTGDSHAVRTGQLLLAFEAVLLETAPDLVVVNGGRDTMLGCALVASTLGVPVAQLEAGLRSFDWNTPDEINRVLIDQLSSVLLTSSLQARDNLTAEGADFDAIQHVGNTMIDAVYRCAPQARALAAWEALGLECGSYVLVTFRRVAHMGSHERLVEIAAALTELAGRVPIVVAADAAALAAWDVETIDADVHAVSPPGYLDYLSLQLGAGAVLTDSGGVQDETTALGIPCFTLRDCTERSLTLTHGTNTLLGEDPAAIGSLTIEPARPASIPFWDGRAGERAGLLLSARLVPASHG
jgi:UDP-N-acetylglucosamine 2-epimerase (non-hydrolysing)